MEFVGGNYVSAKAATGAKKGPDVPGGMLLSLLSLVLSVASASHPATGERRLVTDQVLRPGCPFCASQESYPSSVCIAADAIRPLCGARLAAHSIKSVSLQSSLCRLDSHRTVPRLQQTWALDRIPSENRA